MDPKNKGKGKMKSPSAIPIAVQTVVPLTLSQMLKAMSRKMKMYDKSFEHHTSKMFKTIFEEDLLKVQDIIEGQMLDLVEIDDIKVALVRQTFIDFQMRKSLLQLTVLHKKTILISKATNSR